MPGIYESRRKTTLFSSYPIGFAPQIVAAVCRCGAYSPTMALALSKAMLMWLQMFSSPTEA